VTNRFGYGELTLTALENATRDFAIGLARVPPSLQAALRDLQAGDVRGAPIDMAKASRPRQKTQNCAGSTAKAPFRV
jgi:hypothetical protein